MKLTLSSLALLAAFTLAASAQTTTPHKAATTTTHHHAATTTAASRVPRAPGIPKTLYTLRYIDIVVGKGPLAEPQKWYTVRYTGWLTDGTRFDSSDDHPGARPITFPYGAHQVITGWDTGFEGMHVGGKRRLYVPYQLAYGELGRPPRIPAKANLIFDVELVSMSDNPPAPPAPAPATQPATEPAPQASPAPEARPSTPQPETTPHPQSL